MSGLMLAWLIIAVIAALGLIGIEHWEYRHDPNYEPLTLMHLLQGACLSLIPIVQLMTCAGVVVYFFGEIAPKIVLFGRKKQ